jgi:hypothetical protein
MNAEFQHADLRHFENLIYTVMIPPLLTLFLMSFQSNLLKRFPTFHTIVKCIKLNAKCIRRAGQISLKLKCVKKEVNQNQIHEFASSSKSH